MEYLARVLEMCEKGCGGGVSERYGGSGNHFVQATSEIVASLTKRFELAWRSLIIVGNG